MNQVFSSQVLFRLITALAVLSLFSCASFPEARDIQRSFEFSKERDVVWEGVINYFSSNQIPIQTLEKDSGIVYAEKTFYLDRKDDEYADCPKGGMRLSATNSRSMKMNIFMSSVKDTATTVTINLDFQREYRETNMLGQTVTTSVIDCVSTGVGEQYIYDVIKKYVDGHGDSD